MMMAAGCASRVYLSRTECGRVHEMLQRRQHHEKNGLLLWKRCVNDENLLEDVRDLKPEEINKLN